MTDGVNHQSGVLSLVVDKSIASSVHQKLLDSDLVNSKYKTTNLSQRIAIPIVEKEVVMGLEWFDENEHQITIIDLDSNPRKNTPAKEILSKVTSLCELFGVEICEEMIENLPKKWELYGDLAILPKHSFRSSNWLSILSNQPKLQQQIWQVIARALSVNRLAQQAEISSDRLRTSQVTMLLGENGEVEFTDYGVKFWFDVTKVMFSSGNVTERHRIGSINMADECVIDAFAGIGYYTLPMLVRSGAKHIYACELNPDSIDALSRGARLNGVTNRLTILEGDNQETLRDLTGLADRVHLGILPSSESTWRLAVDCLKPTGGVIHIHMNVKEVEVDEFVIYCLDELRDYVTKHHNFTNVTAIHVEKVKWYAPHIRHIVIDVCID